MLNKLLRLAVSVALLARVACRTEWDKVQAGFADLRLECWLAAAGVLVLAQVVSARRWQCYAQALRLSRSLRQLTGFYFIGMYFNLMLPTSVGGDVVRAWYLDGQSGRRLPAFISVLLDRLNGLLVLVALATLAVAFSPLELPAWITGSVWAVAGCAAASLVSVFLLMRGAAPLMPAVDLTQLSQLEQQPVWMMQVKTALAVFCVPRILAGTLLLSLCVQAASVLVVWLIGEAIHAPIPATYYWVMVPMVSLLTLLPISVNGMGVREEATVLFLAPVGVPESTALSLAVLWFAVYAGVSVMGGAVYLLGRFPKPQARTGARPGLPPARGQAQAALAYALAREVTNGSFRGDSDQGRTGQHRQAA